MPDVRFDVICAGEAQWKVAMPTTRVSGMPLRPGGGAVDLALALARERLHVGLATIMSDDDVGRRSLARLRESRVDTGGVKLARPRGGLVLVDATGAANELTRAPEESTTFEIPESWSSDLLLLSGLSPVTSRAAILCREARRARRRGTLVAIDFNASLHAWAGRDPRTILMVLREVDVARCSVADLAVLGMEIAQVRASLRETAALVVNNAAGAAVATGPFGQVAITPKDARPVLGSRGAGDAFTAAMCTELLRPGDPGESASASWHRALHRGLMAAAAATRVTA
ncbi:MAG: carbohydrate kinase family protein [Deltaproteobacteria bacterium]|nr:carbohydrate kinase family protein [Deltaproteobacteria bacterium]